MTQYIIARHIEGISLNGREHCLDDEGNIVFFESFLNSLQEPSPLQEQSGGNGRDEQSD